MKGTVGAIIAAGLGILAAMSNWFYLSQKAADYEKVSFIAIRSEASLKIGDLFKEDQLAKVDIPRAHLGNLDRVAILWDERAAVVGETAKRVYSGDELLLHEDLRNPGSKRPIDQIGDNEVAISVEVDTASFVAAQINPGDFISIAVPLLNVAKPGGTSADGNQSSPGGQTRVIGPFRVLMVGNRTGSSASFYAAGGSARQEGVITVSVRFEDNTFEPKAQELFEATRQFNTAQRQVLLHPKSFKPGLAP